MQPAETASNFSRPMGAAAAYGAVIRQTDSPRDIEYRVLTRTTDQLSKAAEPQAAPSALAEAVHDNLVLWTTFAADLASTGNAWEDAAKARLLSLAAWVMNESDRVLRTNKSPAALIDINRTVMLGLLPQTRIAPEPVA